MATQQPYAREFTIETMKRVTERGMSCPQVVGNLGRDVGTLWRWMREVDADGAPFPATATHAPLR